MRFRAMMFAMTPTPGGKNWWRIGIFAAVFLISCVLLLGFGLVRLFSFGGSEPGPNGPMATPGDSGGWASFVGVLTTAVTAATSLAGLVLTLRREKRDSVKSDLEIRRMQLDL